MAATVPNDVEGGAGAQPRMTIFSERDGKDLEWHSLTYNVGPVDNPITVLDNVFGRIPKGKVAALMGPSGAGKSSLLNVLAGRVKPSNSLRISGRITIDGEEIDPVANRSNIAYVMQDDSLLPTATPREALSFSAALRLRGEVTDKERDDLVDTMLHELGLDSCADTFVGNALMAGLSGGQRKRTSVGVDLITQPDMIFLDEPTSGLDSYSAHALVQLLKRISGYGCTVACTIHQPSSEVFALFDQVILLKSGRIVYEGDIPEMNDFFGSRGHLCPPNFNPADFAMFVLSMEDEEGMKDKDLYMTQDDSKILSSQVTLESSVTALGADTGASQKSFCTRPDHFFLEILWLTRREINHVRRDTASLASRFGSTLFLNVLFALIFMGSGSEDDSISDNLSTHFGALTMVTISIMFGSALPVATEFPDQRPVFLREYASGSYSAAAYFLSKICIELPLAFVQTLFAALIFFWVVDFQGDFILMLLSWWLLSICAASVAINIGCLVSDVKVTTEFLPPLFVPQLLFAGFFIRIEQVPVYLRWAQWLCSLKYTLNILMLLEFTDECDDDAREGCNNLLEANEVERDHYWVYIICLLGLFAMFRTVAAFILVWRAQTLY